jgi:hypothetical protein
MGGCGQTQAIKGLHRPSVADHQKMIAHAFSLIQQKTNESNCAGESGQGRCQPIQGAAVTTKIQQTLQ